MTQRGMRVACALLLLAAACAARQAPELDSWLKADSQEEGERPRHCKRIRLHLGALAGPCCA